MKRDTLAAIAAVLLVLLIAEVGFMWVSLRLSEAGEPAGASASGTAPPETTATDTQKVTQAAVDAPTQNASETTVETTEEATEEATQPQPESFLITFVGDCTFGCNPNKEYASTGFPSVVGQDYSYPFANVVEYFEADDFTIINLEGALTDGGTPVNKTHRFRGSTAYTQIMTCSSVEAVTLANNHSGDYGTEGYESTRTVLEEAGIAYVEQDDFLIYTTETGLTIGLYAVTYEHVAEQDIYDAITRLVEDDTIDLVIFAPHWGTENSYRANEMQTRISRNVIDLGASIVYTSHAHVLQPIEEYNGGIIYYSMGNFCFGGNTNPKDYDTALIQQEVIRDTDGTVSLGETTLVPCSISSTTGSNNYQPTPWAPDTAEYARILQKLDGTFTGADLPVN